MNSETDYMPQYATYFPFGPVDVNEYDPHKVSANLQDQLKSVAVRLKRYGLDGKKIGFKLIHGYLESIFEDYPAENIPSKRTVSRWISSVDFRPLDSPYDPEDLNPAVRSYAARLSLISQSVFKSKVLTQLEAEVCDRVMREFDDPFGEKVDLVSQFAIVWELAEREASNTGIEDIESLFAYAPWQDKGALYRQAFDANKVSSPILRKLMPEIHGETIPKFLLGAIAHLGLPFHYHEFDSTNDRVSYYSDHIELEEPEVYVKFCKWRDLVSKNLDHLHAQIGNVLARKRMESENKDD